MAVLYAIISSIIAILVAVVAVVCGATWAWGIALYIGTSIAIFATLLASSLILSPSKNWESEVEAEMDALKDHLDSRVGTLMNQIFH